MEKQRIIPFLSFTGKAEEVMNFYAENLPNAKITKLVRYGYENPSAGEGEGNYVFQGVLTFMGQDIMFLDMSAKYPAPDFSWATSIYIDCADEAEFDAIFGALSKEGTVMMGPEPVAHFSKCAWVTDKYGVTWQPVWE